jgi:hypothetical protein
MVAIPDFLGIAKSAIALLLWVYGKSATALLWSKAFNPVDPAKVGEFL